MSTQGNARPLQQLKSGFKRIINRNKYQSKVSTQEQNQYLDYLIDPCFQVVNRPFLLSFENKVVRTQDIVPEVEIKDYNIRINRRNLFDQLEKKYLRKYDNIQKIATGPGD